MSGEYSIFSEQPGDAGPLTVVIADDQALVRGGFRLILKAAGIDVVAEAANGAQAVAAVLAHRPDVVLMDVRMPVMDGIEATRRILADVVAGDTASDATATRIIILTTFDLDEYVYAALSAGASGFLLKDVTPEHLVAAVQLVRTGDALLAPSITRRLVERFASATGASVLPADGSAAGRGGPGSGASAGSNRRGLSRRSGQAGHRQAWHGRAWHGRAWPAGLRRLRADPARTGGPRPDRAGPVQRRDRRGTCPVRGDGQDPRGPHPHQAHPPRPRPGGRPRLRNGPRLPWDVALTAAQPSETSLASPMAPQAPLSARDDTARQPQANHRTAAGSATTPDGHASHRRAA